ncbi:MAG: hypothetical protein AMS21_03125 [Gemmatimonas sp. SG8_38_2]|nr:MAG: hypothetical protein AMS21_03125 [Gemmatimonas sp. SG8_38_2]
MIIDEEVLSGISRQLEAAYPEEACGGLLGRMVDESDVAVVEAVPLDNEREDERRRRYLIGPDAVLALERRAEKAELQVIGFYHSHPDAHALPSKSDREHAWPWYIYLIVQVQFGSATNTRAWRLTEDQEHFAPVAVDARESM